ncbi:MAG: DUF933 domain-containing protein [Candidatus Wallbacteria bacterium]|nr:DUF933 domain-containing protein [Candidatus Wallbacteria bacterium]
MSRAALLGAKNGGKTTIFKILTGISEAKNDSQSLGEVRVHDARLVRLSDLFKPKKTTFASLSIVDFRNDSGKTFQFSPPELGKCELLIFVLRLFNDPSVYYPFGDSLDPMREYRELVTEICLRDLETLEKRQEKIHHSMKSAKKIEREVKEKELEFINSLKTPLEEGSGVQVREFNSQESEWLQGYNLITLQKRMIILNRNDATQENALSQVHSSLSQAGETVLHFDGRMELDLSVMSSEEREEWRKEMGLEYFSSELIQREAYKHLDYITFFTVGEDECRSWPIRKGTSARSAAGKIHTDLERGFIRAEVIPYDDLMRTGSLAAAKRDNHMRLEGADYIVSDGEIVHVRFNV